MPVLVNGRSLGVERNGAFSTSNTDPIPGGRLWPEAALTWNAMRAAFIADGGDPNAFVPGGPASSARSLAQQRAMKAMWTARGQPGKAAQPGTSNHGWAIAVDCPATSAQAWLMRHGGQYGWSHDEGLRVGEPWHFRYVGASKLLLRRLRRDPLAGYTTSEKRWIHEWDHGHPSASRRRVLRRVMTAQRKRVWKAAQPRAKGGDGKGWTKARRRRYASLLARTT